MRVLSDRMHLGRPTHVGPISLFPVWTEGPAVVDYVATERRGLVIRELEDPQVDRLQAHNGTQKSILIPEGTIIRGNQQTRALVRDILLAPGQARHMPVVCVEQGRWGDNVSASITGRVAFSVAGAIRDIDQSGGNPFIQWTNASERQAFREEQRRREYRRQTTVWKSVRKYEDSYGKRTSSSLDSIINDVRSDMKIDYFELAESGVLEVTDRRDELWSQIEHFANNPLSGQNGVLIGMLGHPVALEHFANRQAFTAQLPMLLRAAVTDAALIDTIPTPTHRAHSFADAVMDTKLNFMTPGSRLLIGGNELVDVRSHAIDLNGADTLHTSVVNRRHELVLAG